MKKLLFFGLIISLFSSCNKGETIVDWLHTHSFTWTNESTHTVTLSLPELSYDDVESEMRGFDVVIAPGESHTEEILSQANILPGNYGIWKMTVAFDDGAYSVLYDAGLQHLPPGQIAYPEHYDYRYDPTLKSNYIFEVLSTSRGGKSRWTYIFTDHDFDAAKAYTE